MTCVNPSLPRVHMGSLAALGFDGFWFTGDWTTQCVVRFRDDAGTLRLLMHPLFLHAFVSALLFPRPSAGATGMPWRTRHHRRSAARRATAPHVSEARAAGRRDGTCCCAPSLREQHFSEGQGGGGCLRHTEPEDSEYRWESGQRDGSWCDELFRKTVVISRPAAPLAGDVCNSSGGATPLAVALLVGGRSGVDGAPSSFALLVSGRGGVEESLDGLLRVDGAPSRGGASVKRRNE